MRDAYDAQMWADHHNAFTAQISHLIDDVLAGFATLSRRQFDAPWSRPGKTHRIGDV